MVHLLSDLVGQPAVVPLTPGNASDVRTAPDVRAGRLERLLADWDYDANHLRSRVERSRQKSAIPNTVSRKRSIPCDRRRYTDHWRIDAARSRRKDFAAATRYNKLVVHDASTVMLAAVIAFRS